MIKENKDQITEQNKKTDKKTKNKTNMILILH
jgi:hypothetical protein